MKEVRLFAAVNIAVMAIVAGLVVGCGTASLDAGYDDRDNGTDRPASLVEVEFGPFGETEVTKNIPGDAARGVQRAVRSISGQPPAISADE